MIALFKSVPEVPWKAPGVTLDLSSEPYGTAHSPQGLPCTLYLLPESGCSLHGSWDRKGDSRLLVQALDHKVIAHSLFSRNPCSSYREPEHLVRPMTNM